MSAWDLKEVVERGKMRWNTLCKEKFPDREPLLEIFKKFLADFYNVFGEFYSETDKEEEHKNYLNVVPYEMYMESIKRRLQPFAPNQFFSKESAINSLELILENAVLYCKAFPNPKYLKKAETLVRSLKAIFLSGKYDKSVVEREVMSLNAPKELSAQMLPVQVLEVIEEEEKPERKKTDVGEVQPMDLENEAVAMAPVGVVGNFDTQRVRLTRPRRRNLLTSLVDN